MKIKSIIAREILDSRGNPTVEAEVLTESGIYSAAVPSGASTGRREALELRDGDKRRYDGKGVLKAVGNIMEIIAPALIGAEATKQAEIDNRLLELDGSENKSRLGANAILAVSAAVCRAGAGDKRIALYSHIAELGENDKLCLPVPMVLVLEGGKHADQSSDFQEFMIMPRQAPSFNEAIRIGSEIYQAIGRVLKSQGFNTNVGFEGAYGPDLKSNEKALKVIIAGITEAGYKPGEEVVIAIDAAASEFYGDRQYELKADRQKLSSLNLVNFYSNLASKYPIFSLEDGMAEDDWDGWIALMEKIGGQVQIVGDDLTVTNPAVLKKAIERKAINSILIKLNQIGTVSETIAAVNLAKKNGLTAVVSHRSAETEDTFIADLVVGLGTGQSKFGATARGERVAKYNRLLKIEQELGAESAYNSL